MTSNVTADESSRFQAERAEAWRKWADETGLAGCNSIHTSPPTPSPVFTITEKVDTFHVTFSAPSVDEMMTMMDRYRQFIIKFGSLVSEIT